MKRVMSSPPSKDAVSVPTFKDVARFVAGPDAPAWLVAHFKRWANSLELIASSRKSSPLKSR
jgi:hypothetical protein